MLELLVNSSPFFSLELSILLRSVTWPKAEAEFETLSHHCHHLHRRFVNLQPRVTPSYL